jgi:peptidoglycan hydrolase CwlO-like protein
MPDDSFIDLVHQVDRHEGELERDGKDIETLRKEIAALKSDIQNLVHFR